MNCYQTMYISYVHVNTNIKVFLFCCSWVIGNSSLISRDIIFKDSTITPSKSKTLLRAQTNNLGFQEDKCELPNHSIRMYLFIAVEPRAITILKGSSTLVVLWCFIYSGN